MNVSANITKNKIIYDQNYEKQVNRILDKFFYEYVDEFAAFSFLDKYHQAIADLELVDETVGKLPSIKLTKAGFRRKIIKRYKYVIIYKYHDKIVELRYIFPSRMDYLRLIK